MGAVISIIDISTKSKPLEPCNNCGYCCATSVCGPGLSLVYGGPVSWHGVHLDEPCKALVQTAYNKFSCNLIINPNQYIKNEHAEESNREAIKTVLMAGVGCNCFEEVKSKKENQKLRAKFDKLAIQKISRQQFANAWQQVFSHLSTHQENA